MLPFRCFGVPLKLSFITSCFFLTISLMIKAPLERKPKRQWKLKSPYRPDSPQRVDPEMDEAMQVCSRYVQEIYIALTASQYTQYTCFCLQVNPKSLDFDGENEETLDEPWEQNIRLREDDSDDDDPTWWMRSDSHDQQACYKKNILPMTIS